MVSRIALGHDVGVRMASGAIVRSTDDWQVLAGDLRNAVVLAVDLQQVSNWDSLDLGGAAFLGCSLPPGAEGVLRRHGALVLPPIVGFPFDPYRCTLYTREELMAGFESGGLQATLDSRIVEYFRRTSGTDRNVRDALAQALHDAGIDEAVRRFVTDGGRRVVGIMGGHALSRDATGYQAVAKLAWLLARRGYCVATGGGPGVMEAANLGAWLSGREDSCIDDAIGVLKTAPSFRGNPDAYVARGLEVVRQFPMGEVSLGIPTWVYGHEPTSAFSTHIAKYFANSIRENGLLAIALSGVVYAPGGAGTAQEIFTDAAQNTYSIYEVRSPMVFFGREHYLGANAALLAAAQAQAVQSPLGTSWDHNILVTDNANEVVAFIGEHDPTAQAGDPEVGTVTVSRRRRG